MKWLSWSLRARMREPPLNPKSVWIQSLWCLQLCQTQRLWEICKIICILGNDNRYHFKKHFLCAEHCDEHLINVISLIITTTLWGRYHYLPFFTDEETEFERSNLPTMKSSKWLSPNQNLGSYSRHTTSYFKALIRGQCLTQTLPIEFEAWLQRLQEDIYLFSGKLSWIYL